MGSRKFHSTSYFASFEHKLNILTNTLSACVDIVCGQTLFVQQGYNGREGEVISDVSLLLSMFQLGPRTHYKQSW